ncbi:hypothetical protein SAMN05421770_101863 [Granulicella rosea]|uniref:Uncharacterized protein n=1 Tax=Granulicella rosea TaxID=474952 RepID=A0A239EBC0_9BACT|nr:hypothetical protein [Granulicella rosea]SNS41212.1 hypothetical protein SAMN05421770_101863 [Granulicella rosea]
MVAKKTRKIWVPKTEDEKLTVQRQLDRLLLDDGFAKSERCGDFLRFIVQRTLADEADSLKERVLGIEVFGRNPSYDTINDPIVRVTASKIRKRISKYYEDPQHQDELRVSCPAGSYVPVFELLEDETPEPSNSDSISEHTNRASVKASAPAAELPEVDTAPDPLSLSKSGLESSVIPHQASSVDDRRGRLRWVILGSLLGTIVAGFLAGLAWYRSSRATTSAARIPPWSALFNSSHPTHLITSDYALVVLRGISGNSVPLADYANRKYIAEPNKLTPEELRYFDTVFSKGSSTSDVDAPIIARISALAQENHRVIDARASRHITISDLRTDDNFIFVGSPSSNPWSSLFSNELDFQFVIDKDSQQEIVRNVRPSPHELPVYVPTALGGATGESYAIIALVPNLDQNGQVLLVGGANGEGTDAAGRLITDPTRLSTALSSCGIGPGSALRYFELLLRLSTLAGSPTHLDVAACHLLPGTPPR